MLRTLLRRATRNGAAVDAKDKYDWTALHCAAAHGHESVTKLLFLCWAAQEGHEHVAKLLLENGAA